MRCVSTRWLSSAHSQMAHTNAPGPSDPLAAPPSPPVTPTSTPCASPEALPPPRAPYFSPAPPAAFVPPGASDEPPCDAAAAFWGGEQQWLPSAAAYWHQPATVAAAAAAGAASPGPFGPAGYAPAPPPAYAHHVPYHISAVVVHDHSGGWAWSPVGWVAAPTMLYCQ